jgi:hypothetical protein
MALSCCAFIQIKKLILSLQESLLNLPEKADFSVSIDQNGFAEDICLKISLIRKFN